MTDNLPPLVERLRCAALPGTNRHALDEEAAEEIERLRSERDVQDAALVCLRADLRDCATARDAELERHKALMQAVKWLLDDGHMNQEHLARLRAAFEAA